MTVPNLQFNGNWLSVPWAEFIGKDASHGATWNAGWEDGGTQSTFSILVNWKDGPIVEPAILGTAVFNSDTNTLTRTLPVRHPYKSDAFAERIVSATPVKWDSKINDWVAENMAVGAGARLSQYLYWLIVIGFAKPKYRLMTDAVLDRTYGSPRQEWRRFVEINVMDRVETFSREGANWKWQAGPNNGQLLTAPLSSDIYAAEWHVKWRRLPRLGVFANAGADERFNQNIIACRNKVHNGATNLWNMPGNANTGTLRLVSVKATPVGSPFDPLVQGLGDGSYNTYVDLDMVFTEWNPPYGDVGNQGWNLAPNPSDNLWWLVGTEGTGATRFQMADLTTAFQLSLT